MTRAPGWRHQGHRRRARHNSESIGAQLGVCVCALAAGAGARRPASQCTGANQGPSGRRTEAECAHIRACTSAPGASPILRIDIRAHPHAEARARAYFHQFGSGMQLCCTGRRPHNDAPPPPPPPPRADTHTRARAPAGSKGPLPFKT